MIKNIYKWYQKNSSKKYLTLRKLAFGITKQLTHNSPCRPWISDEDDLSDIESLFRIGRISKWFLLALHSDIVYILYFNFISF